MVSESFRSLKTSSLNNLFFMGFILISTVSRELELTIDQFIKIGVQINGKRRGEVQIKRNLPEKEILTIILDDEKLKKYFDGLQIKKTILIKDRVINIIL